MLGRKPLLHSFLPALGSRPPLESTIKPGRFSLPEPSPVGDPATHCRAAQTRATGVHQQLSRRVIELLGVHSA